MKARPSAISTNSALQSTNTIYTIYGLAISSNLPFTSHLQRRDATPDLTVTLTAVPPHPLPPATTPPAYHTPGQPTNGRNSLAFYPQPTHDLLRADGLADFYLQPEQIICHLQQPVYDHWVEIRLLGTILAFWLERQGIPALHASAVVVDGQAVGFLSTNRGGKSSLAAAFVQAGYPLVTDDILPVEGADGRFLARPAYPQMRMWPPQADHFLGRSSHLDPIHPAYPKLRVPVGPGGFGAFCEGARPLACLYIPERRDPAAQGSEVEITAVSQVEAAVALVRYSFMPRLTQAAGLQPQRLDFFVRLVRQIPIRRLIYPSGYEHLPRVRDAVLEDLAYL